ncbi:MAG: OB-fold domain-containing protein [Proteobacteria bacterium]|nr:OB-fold domain-containing protein [Pseudomonadota bacterium]
MSASPRTKPVPEPSEISLPFWEAARRGELRIQRCDDCGQRWWIPKAACPRCLSEAYRWERVSGRGTLYSWSAVHRPADPEAFGDEIPYLVAIVRLEEGPHMLTRMTACEPEDLVKDMPVEVVFEQASDEITLYKFRPAPGAGGGDPA